ncbi:hypothetical protein P378_10155 [Desulforamulus profundi]|uniref:Uncharacterized protein n=1 Tax=Desulforamulus profundi TaxID=1383067 RepID=A0A2C6MFI1_9FIRM|nr:hypothetical protein [Desulforamulus profundi]PHJ38414.1 hypothetical protein P378_10155 [Desulforamulus profundi]
MFGWNIAIIYLANMHNAIVATLKGHFNLAQVMVDYQWLLFFPSIYIFAIWDSYNDCLEMNTVFDEVAGVFYTPSTC